jgi:hypothetical protein
MRIFAIPLLLLFAGSAKVCSSEDKAKSNDAANVKASASASGSATANVKAAIVAPRIGGVVAAAGDFSVELAVHQLGLVEALVSDASGKLVSDGVKLKALVQVKGSATEQVELAFSPAHARFEGHAKAGVELVPGPIDVTLDIGGKALSCQLNAAVVLPEPHFGGQVMAVGDFAVELVASGPEVRAYVFDASGKARATGDLDLKLAIGAAAGSNLVLSWDAPSLSYVGRLAADAKLALQPVRLTLVANGKAFVGAVASLSAAAKVDTNLKGKLDAGAKAKLDEAAKLSARAASASVKITPPKLNASAKASTGAKAGAGAKAGGSAKASAGISF